MMRALWTAASGMSAQELNMDVVANNLANVNTTGFKRSRVDFHDLMYQTLLAAGTTMATGAESATGIQVGLGTSPAAIQKMFTQGDFQITDNALDLAVEGDGFFQVLMPDGTIAYSRDGSFKRDSDGRLVTSDGYPVEPEVRIPPEAISVGVGSDGTVTVLLPGQAEPEQVGTIQLAKFLNPAGLNAIGHNLFIPTGASGEAVPGTAGSTGFGRIAQGKLEMSNVSMIDEMVNMIVAQRAYEINSKSVQTADDMLSIANNLRR